MVNTEKIKAVMQRWRLKEKDTSYLNKRVVVVDTLLDVTIGFFQEWEWQLWTSNICVQLAFQ